MTETSPEPEKRECYRLHFPRTERPLLVIDQYHYEIVDCSAQGLRCHVNDWQPPISAGKPVEGLVQFRNQAPARVHGVVIRIQDNEIVLYLPDSEIPFAVLRGEERHLIARYRAGTE